MKKKASTTGFIIAIVIVMAIATMSNAPEPTYKFTFTAQQLQTLFYVVDNSAAPHNLVKEVETELNRQYIPQIDTTKNK